MASPAPEKPTAQIDAIERTRQLIEEARITAERTKRLIAEAQRLLHPNNPE
jgi:hypothetical protein